MAALTLRTGSPLHEECSVCLELLSNTQDRGPAVVHSGDGKRHPFHQKCIEQIFPKADGYYYCPACDLHINVHSIIKSNRPFPLNYLLPPVQALQGRVVNYVHALNPQAIPCAAASCMFILIYIAGGVFLLPRSNDA